MLESVRTSGQSPLPQVPRTSVAAVASWLIAALALGQPAPVSVAIAALLGQQFAASGRSTERRIVERRIREEILGTDD